jgi:CRP/FNR family cyclic AMP-dependent transcriptional regulator
MASLSPLLSRFSADDLAQLASFGESRHYAPGDVIIREGEVNEHLYLILRGSVEVTKKRGHQDPRFIAEISITGSLGEVSIFDPGPSSATVQAKNDVEVWRITQAQLDRMHEIRPKVAYSLISRICGCLAQRLRELTEQVVDERERLS